MFSKENATFKNFPCFMSSLAETKLKVLKVGVLVDCRVYKLNMNALVIILLQL